MSAYTLPRYLPSAITLHACTSNLPLETAQSEKTNSHGRNSSSVPRLVPVLVAEVPDSSDHSEVDCGVSAVRHDTLKLTESSKTTSDTRTKDNLLGLEVRLGTLPLRSLGLLLALGRGEVGFGNVAENQRPSR